MRPLADILADIADNYEKDLAGREVLLLVFQTASDRAEFVELVKKAKPGMCDFILPPRKATK